jgi:hypothetical protein
MITRVLAALSLLVCLGTGVLFFWGSIGQGAYKTILALGSLSWFIFATLSIRRKTGP